MMPLLVDGVDDVQAGPTEAQILNMTAHQWEVWKDISLSSKRVSPEEVQRLADARYRKSKGKNWNPRTGSRDEDWYRPVGRQLRRGASAISRSPITGIVLSAAAFTPLAPLAAGAAVALAATEAAGRSMATGKLDTRVVGQVIASSGGPLTQAAYQGGTQLVRAAQGKRVDYGALVNAGTTAFGVSSADLVPVEVRDFAESRIGKTLIKQGSNLARGERVNVRDLVEVVPLPESLHRQGERIYRQGREIYRQGEQVYRQGEQVYRQGEQVYRQGEQVYRQGEQVYRQGEAMLQQARSLPSTIEAQVKKGVRQYVYR